MDELHGGRWLVDRAGPDRSDSPCARRRGGWRCCPGLTRRPCSGRPHTQREARPRRPRARGRCGRLRRGKEGDVSRCAPGSKGVGEGGRSGSSREGGAVRQPTVVFREELLADALSDLRVVAVAGDGDRSGHCGVAVLRWTTRRCISKARGFSSLISCVGLVRCHFRSSQTSILFLLYPRALTTRSHMSYE